MSDDEKIPPTPKHGSEKACHHKSPDLQTVRTAPKKKPEKRREHIKVEGNVKVHESSRLYQPPVRRNTYRRDV